MRYIVYCLICLAIARLPFIIKGWATVAAIKRESKKATKENRWMYDIILK